MYPINQKAGYRSGLPSFNSIACPRAEPSAEKDRPMLIIMRKALVKAGRRLLFDNLFASFFVFVFSFFTLEVKLSHQGVRIIQDGHAFRKRNI